MREREIERERERESERERAREREEEEEEEKWHLQAGVTVGKQLFSHKSMIVLLFLFLNF